MVYHHDIFINIQKSCLESICIEPEILSKSVKFINLSAPSLEIILKRDDLLLNEIEVWENLIKWELAQEKILDDDVSKWNQEKFNIFGRILYKFIPLIRFYYISSEDYYYKVKPYEQILSKELREDILKFYLVPRYKSPLNKYEPRYSKKINVDSVLINQNHIEIFAKWIDKIEGNPNYSFNNLPYKFNLILRGSRDGFDHASFHNKCNNKGANIVVIKIKNSDQIVGGYNPLDWEGFGLKNTRNSFLFSFSDYRNFDSGKISKIINNNYSAAVISDPDWGPVFGKCSKGKYSNGSHDLCMHGDGKWSSYPYCYRDIGIPRNYFDIDDYEVFQVEKKILFEEYNHDI
ncbi:hypothetical protein C1645_839871 [Glomus cerebriforme]|uniref:TLDc domain-containing protein n=1 Tax=Glomus cerebriforme TaxID=658196 RepID=A0A397S000_9GLOM|nr:hypothetical protein C1645_839871 [Glomus cerebriforme]